MGKPRVKADADGVAPAGAKEGGPGATETTGASVGVTLVNKAGPEAETGKGAEMGMESGAETGAGGVVETEMESEDDTETETVEDTGLARGEELGTGIGEEAGPGSEDGTGREEEMVKGAAPGAEAVETEDKLAPELFSYSFCYPVPPLPLPLKLYLFPRKPSLPYHEIKDSRNLTTFPFPPRFQQMYLIIRQQLGSPRVHYTASKYARQ